MRNCAWSAPPDSEKVNGLPSGSLAVTVWKAPAVSSATDTAPADVMVGARLPIGGSVESPPPPPPPQAAMAIAINIPVSTRHAVRIGSTMATLLVRFTRSPGHGPVGRLAAGAQ